jgi:hypothetical protein
MTKTTNNTSDEKEKPSNNDNNNNENPKRESSMEIKSIKLHAHSARVTKDDVDVQVTFIIITMLVRRVTT